MVEISAIVGYAIGTAQVLAIDWIRRRFEHRRHLRVLRAELQRVLTLSKPFGWSDPATRSSESMPIPPRVSPKFYDLVTSIDFYLTDEHSDDNTQLGLLVLADGCALLEHYQKRVFDLGTRLNQTPSPEDSVDLQAEMVELANAYDRELDVTLFTARDALRDVNRRLAEVRFWRQINRPIGELPQGKNPTPISAGDPRLAAEQTEGNT